MNHQLDSLLLLAAQTAPAPVSQPRASALANDNPPVPEAIGELLTGLLRDETALYAVTRDRRYDVAAREFIRLHALLNEQFTEIGIRVVKLAARSRALGSPISRRHDRRSTPCRAAVDDDALEARLMSELLDHHEALLLRLRPGEATIGDQLHDPKTTKRLADLIAEHEKDAFMLRALLWEVQNTAP